MTCENRHEAAKNVGDVLTGRQADWLRDRLGEPLFCILYDHLVAIQNGYHLRMIEVCLLHPDWTPDQLTEKMIRRLKDDPNYIPAGQLPESTKEAFRDEPGNTALERSRIQATEELLRRLSTQYPVLHQALLASEKKILSFMDPSKPRQHPGT